MSEQQKTSPAELARYLFERHHSILITGGTGTFGRAFARYALENGSQRVCIYSRGEHAQASLREELKAWPDQVRYFIGDVRDDARLETAMHGSTLVIHAAALKRVEVGEYNPLEMVQTNVQGAVNVIRAAWACSKRYGNHRPVHTVFLSSDKACAPVNTYGATKLVAEKLFMGAGNMYSSAGPLFTVTRYGNVAGSQGSVIPIWRQAIARGEMRKITAPDATRFWMTLDEAVQLVVQAATTTVNGTMLVPKLPAYTLDSLAAAMMVAPMLEIGLQPGEKQHESMISDDEAADFYDAGDLYVRPGPTDREGCRHVDRRQTALRSDTGTLLTVDQIRQRLKELPHG